MQKFLITIIMLAGITAAAQHQKTYQLDTQKSIINWTGSYSFLMSEHKGTVQFKKGELFTTNGNISGGAFTIDMKSISNEEFLSGVGPVAHIRNEDFFNVEKYPEARLVITSVEFFPRDNRHKMLADLTIKGITKPIEFWPEVDEVRSKMTVQFKIDRTRWGITYNNKLKNDAISEAIEFDVVLQF
jgi:polyisoprenoid-binding protein YceI